MNPPVCPIERIMGRMALNFRSTAAHAILMMMAGWIHREQEAVVAYQRRRFERSRRCSAENDCTSPTHSAAG
jgi:hypothetical protein